MTIEELSKLVESKRRPIVINRGVTPLSLLGIAFIVLKVSNHITWSWMWILAPFWIPLCLAIVITISLLFIIGKAANDIVSKAENIAEDTNKKKKTKNTSKKKSDEEESSGKPKEENV